MVEYAPNNTSKDSHIESLNAELRDPDTSLERVLDIQAIAESLAQGETTAGEGSEIDLAQNDNEQLKAMLLSPEVSVETKEAIAGRVLERDRDDRTTPSAHEREVI